MIVLWMLYILPAVGIYKLTKKYSVNKWIHRGVLVILILIPTYDIILTNILGGYYCLTTPSTYVNKKVEYPLSIYWEDNIYPGFSAEDRKLMIINYLDGKHLQAMALNGDDGKIYVYEVNASIWEPIKPLEHERGQKYFDTIKAIGDTIIRQNQKIYTKEMMPKMNYAVTFNEVKLNPLSRKFLYSDETKIIDNTTQRTIAYNRRYMRFFYNIAPDFAQGNNYYVQYPICGERMEHLEYELFDAYQWSEVHLGTHARNLHEILIKRNLKGER